MVILSKTPDKTKTGQIVTLDRAKKQLQISADFQDDDEMIQDLIETAIEAAENDTNSDVQLTDNVIEYTIETSGLQTSYRIMQAPFLSFTKLERYDGQAWVEVPAAGYKVESFFQYFSLVLTERFTAEKLRFTFRTGFETDAKVPKVLKQAILLKVADLYDAERQGYTLGTVQKNNAYERLVAKHIRQYWG